VVPGGVHERLGFAGTGELDLDGKAVPAPATSSS
jgi:hypothetical protein